MATTIMKTGEERHLKMNEVYRAVANGVIAARTPIMEREKTPTVIPCPSAHCTETDATNTITQIVQAVTPDTPPITREDDQKSAATTSDL